MNDQNIFAAPRAEVRDMAGGAGLITDAIVTALRKTRPWVLFLAVMGFIASLFTVLGGVSALFGAMMMKNVSGMEDSMPAIGSSMMVGAGMLYMVSGVIYFMASWYLLKYAGAIKRLIQSLAVVDLEMALNYQASFWKLLGILALVTIVLVIGILVLGGSALFMSASHL